MTEFEAQVLADLSVLKSQMKEVVGNGQPGRISRWRAGCSTTRSRCSG